MDQGENGLVPFKNSRGRSVGVQCTAPSRRTGNRCRRFTGHPGLSVCRFHGGATPVVRAAADRRLALLGPHALRAIAEILDDPTSHERLRAVRYVVRMMGITPENLWKNDPEVKSLPAGKGGTPTPPSVEEEIEALLRGLRDTDMDENTGQETDKPPR